MQPAPQLGLVAVATSSVLDMQCDGQIVSNCWIYGDWLLFILVLSMDALKLIPHCDCVNGEYRGRRWDYQNDRGCHL